MNKAQAKGDRNSMKYKSKAFMRCKDVMRAFISLVPLGILIAASVMLSSCGAGTTVTMKELSFDPDVVTIKKGETVTWNNEDRRDRQVMSGHPPIMTEEFMSPVLKKGESWSHTFNDPGEYAYHDMRVPGLLGRVVVEE